jgi:hypothetical protein
VSGPAAARGRLRLASPDGAFTAAVDPVGARVASIVHAATGTEFLLRTPWGDEDWSGAHPLSGSDQEWHRRYAGGWHTLVPHAGDARAVDGVEHPFHGEAAWRRWRAVEASASSCTFEVVLRTAPLTVRRRVEATGTGLAVRQTVANHSGRETAFSWTEHPAFGSALIGPDTTVRIGDDPVAAVFPPGGGSHAGFQTVRAKGRGTAAIANPAKGTGAVLRWDPELLPYLYVWQEHRKTPGFPWWGVADTVALEPASRPYESDGGPLGPLGPLVLAGAAALTAAFELDLTCDTTAEETR